MTIEEAIEAALFGRVRDLWMFAADRKAWPNITFDPPADAYLRVDLLPNGNERLFIKGSDPHLHLGILQLTAVSALHEGPSPATRLAGLVAAEFPADLALHVSGVKVRVTKAPDVARAFPTDARWEAPVSIRYETFAAEWSVAGLDFSVPSNSQYIPLI